MEARRITGAAYKASSDAVHGAGGRHCEREEAGASERGNEKPKKKEASEVEGERTRSSAVRPWTYITRKRPTGRGEREKDRGGSRKRTKRRVDGVRGLKMKDKGRRCGRRRSLQFSAEDKEIPESPLEPFRTVNRSENS